MVSKSHFGFVNGKKTVGNIFDLVKGLVLAANLEQITLIDQKITFPVFRNGTPIF